MPRHGKPIYEVTVNGRTRWVVHVSLTRGGHRKQVKKTFDTRGEAEQFYAQGQLGDVVPRARDTFDDWADRWIARKKNANLRPVTLAGYSSDLSHPRRAFGTYRVQDITEDQVEELVRALANKGKSKRTIGKMLGTLRAVFQFAVRKNVLRVNPAQDVEAQGKAAKARDALTVAELEALRRAIEGDPWEACWMLTLAGLRRSELLGLHWSDFDAKTGELTIRRGRGIIGGEQDPKTSTGSPGPSPGLRTDRPSQGPPRTAGRLVRIR